LVWPILILLLWRLFGRRSRDRLVVPLGVLGGLSLLGCVIVTRLAQPWAFFVTPFRAWEFAIGGVAGMASVSWLERHRKAISVSGWIGACAILMAATMFDQRTSFPGAAALLPAGGTALVLLAGAVVPSASLPRTLSQPGLLYVGRVSYSWYLWHWPVLLFAEAVWPHGGARVVLPAVLLSLALAGITNVLVENPLRYSTALRPRPFLSLALACVVMFVSVGCSGLGFWAGSSAANGGNQLALTKAHDDVPALYTSQCIAAANQAAVHVPRCFFGDTTGSRTVVLLGDSHAVQWYPALDRVARQRHWRLLVLTKTSCPASVVTVYNDALGRAYAECDKWRQAALDTILTRHPDAVFVAHSEAYVFPLRDVSPSAWVAGLQTTLRRLDAAGIPTFLFRDSPRPGFDVPTCLARASWRGTNASAACTVARVNALQRALLDLDRRAVSGLEHVMLLDLSDAICSARTCEPIRNGTVVYRDTNHLTATFVVKLTPLLEARVPILPPTGSPVVGERIGNLPSRVRPVANN
jgi:hypothetical protein